MCFLFGKLYSPQNVESGQPIPFIGDIGCCSQWTNGAMSICKPGKYLIIVSASGAATTTATEPQTIQLFENGTAVTGVSASELSTGASDVVNMTFTAIVDIGRSCACVNNKKTLQVISTGNAFLFTSAQVVVSRI